MMGITLLVLVVFVLVILFCAVVVEKFRHSSNANAGDKLFDMAAYEAEWRKYFSDIECVKPAKDEEEVTVCFI